MRFQLVKTRVPFSYPSKLLRVITYVAISLRLRVPPVRRRA